MDPLSAVRHLPVLVRWHNPPECQARSQPDIPVRCRVELVRAQCTKGGQHHDHPDRVRRQRAGSGPGRDHERAASADRIPSPTGCWSSLAEAEDALQETYARWYAMTRQQEEAIENPGAWLMTVASRIPRIAAPRHPPPPGRPASSGTSKRPGKPGTSPPSSASWIPAPRPPPTPAASSGAARTMPKRQFGAPAAPFADASGGAQNRPIWCGLLRGCELTGYARRAGTGHYAAWRRRRLVM